VAIGRRRPAAGGVLLRRRRRARRGAQARFEPLHRLLSGKYYIDEFYEAVSAGRCTGSRTRSSCAWATASCSTARSTAWPRSRVRAAGRLSRVQTGSLHLYAFLVLAGHGRALLWSWRHG
jgi:NADH-quinone oxidoreductase subunit L